MKSKIFDQRQMEFIKETGVGKYKRETLVLLNAEFGTSFTFNQVDGFMTRNKIHTGLTGHFKKGEASWNKGKTMETVGRMRETQFKKGQAPVNWRPVGSERITKDGYVEVKVSEPSEWDLKHRVVYRQHFGAIPKGHVVLFNNQQTTDCCIENLLLVSRRQLAILNRRKLLSKSKEVNKSALLIADLLLKIGDVRKK